MTGWLWQSGRDTPRLYDTPPPQRDVEPWRPQSLSAGRASKRSFPSMGRGCNSSVLVTLRPTRMPSAARGSGVGILRRWAHARTAVSLVVQAHSALPGAGSRRCAGAVPRSLATLGRSGWPKALGRRQLSASWPDRAGGGKHAVVSERPSVAQSLPDG